MADVAQTELPLLWVRKAATHMNSEVVWDLSTFQSYMYYIDLCQLVTCLFSCIAMHII